MDKDHFEIVISGVGGQGVVTCGEILGTAASIYDDKFAVMTCAYGVSARGGLVQADVLIGNDFISYYEALEPDLVLVLSNKIYPCIKSKIMDTTIVVINSDEVAEFDKNRGNIYALPLSKIAFKSGSLRATNMIALGFIAGKTSIVNKTALLTVVRENYPSRKAVEINSRALEQGFRLGQSFS